MPKPRDTLVYRLKKGRKVVYIGTTNDPERREREHRRAGHEFDKIVPVTRRMTPDGARSREADSLATYRRGHRGRNPEYNEDPNG